MNCHNCGNEVIDNCGNNGVHLCAACSITPEGKALLRGEEYMAPTPKEPETPQKAPQSTAPVSIDRDAIPEGAMICHNCGNDVVDNCGNVEALLCGSCCNTPQGHALMRGEIYVPPAPKEQKEVETGEEPPKPSQDRGLGNVTYLIIGIVLAVSCVLGYGYFAEYSKKSIIKEMLAYRAVPVESLEITTYFEMPIKGQSPYINIEAYGVSNGGRFYTKLQYQKGREMSRNGYHFQQGGSTITAGMFYNF